MFICFKGITSRLSSKNHDNLFRKKEAINPFLANVPTLYPLKTPENQSSHQNSSVKKVFLEISQNSQQNTRARVSFLIKLQASGLQRY